MSTTFPSMRRPGRRSERTIGWRVYTDFRKALERLDQERTECRLVIRADGRSQRPRARRPAHDPRIARSHRPHCGAGARRQRQTGSPTRRRCWLTPKRTTVLALQMPTLHVAAAGHTAHALPPLPHAFGAVPARHWPDVPRRASAPEPGEFASPGRPPCTVWAATALCRSVRSCGARRHLSRLRDSAWPLGSASPTSGVRLCADESFGRALGRIPRAQGCRRPEPTGQGRPVSGKSRTAPPAL